MIRFHVVLLALLSMASALAHEGHDHGSPEVSLPTTAAPRATAESEDFELVAVLDAGKLQVYLDRYASNAPVVDADIELESGGFKAMAKPVAPGVYVLPGERFVPAGTYPLTFTVQAGDSFDLLATTLLVAPPSAPPADDVPALALPKALGWSGLAGLLGVAGLLGLAAWLWRRRRA